MPQETNRDEGSVERSQWKGYLQIAAILGVVAVALYFARAPERIDIVGCDRVGQPGAEAGGSRCQSGTSR